MSTTNSSPIDFSSPVEDAAAKAVGKRYEGLVTVRTKAIKGKGAWYWAHLEPILVRSADTGLPKAVKLRCSLCEASFSASNPSRTASEHLKRGTCPNFNSLLKSISPQAPHSPSPIASLPSPSSHNHKRRNSHMGNAQPFRSAAPVAAVGPLSLRRCGGAGGGGGGGDLEQNSPVQNAFSRQHLMLSGGKEDLGALALLEDSVKRLKSPKASPGPPLSKDQICAALDSLADWFYESCGSVSFSSLEHPKFRAFLGQVGLPAVSPRDFAGARLDSKFDEVRMESEARVRDALFFQLASDGWTSRNSVGCGEEENLVKFTVNLPNGTSVFHKALFTGVSAPSSYAEEVLAEMLASTCGGVGSVGQKKCVGIVADKYKASALRNLEIQNHWMVNLSCQLQGVISLIKDFCKELLLFETVSRNCLKVANFFNGAPQIRNCFRRFQLQELDNVRLLRVPGSKCDSCSRSVEHVCTMLEDVISHGRVLQLVVLDDSYKVMCMEDPAAGKIAEMVHDVGFWNELEAVDSLIKLIKGTAQEIEAERPLVGQCLPLWGDLRTKIKSWCSKFNVAEGPVEKIVDKRFRKNYHPAWSAAFILDPLYLMRDASGKYLPPFKCLTHEQEKDVDKLLTRLVAEDEAHIVINELMRWRSEGLDPLYAQAVQVKQQDPVTGKMRIANPQSSRLVWETCLSEFKSLGKVAVRLVFLHATSCGFKCSWSLLRWACFHGHSRVGVDRAQKMIFISAQAKLERRDFSNEEEKDAELFAVAAGEDEMLNEVFAGPPSA